MRSGPPSAGADLPIGDAAAWKAAARRIGGAQPRALSSAKGLAAVSVCGRGCARSTAAPWRGWVPVGWRGGRATEKTRTSPAASPVATVKSAAAAADATSSAARRRPGVGNFRSLGLLGDGATLRH